MTRPRAANPPTGLLRSEKITPRHQDRVAIVYVRQSTVQQVLDHQESTRLQYGLVTRARDLGWAAERIVVIDDDLGQSGASAAGLCWPFGISVRVERHIALASGRDTLRERGSNGCRAVVTGTR